MTTLQDGITAFRAGNVGEARKHFVAAIKENPKNENAWGWLYQASKDDKERIYCLNKILEINPNNERVKQQLSSLTEKSKAAPLPETKTAANPRLAKKDNNALLLVGAGVLVLLLFCCIAVAFSLNSSGSSNSSDSPTSDAPDIFSTDTKVKYVVTGSAIGAFVTYNNEQGGTEQADVNLPWAKEMTVPLGSFLTIVAQNNGSGSITCEIWADGEKIKTSTSTAQYGVVTCSDLR